MNEGKSGPVEIGLTGLAATALQKWRYGALYMLKVVSSDKNLHMEK